MSTLEQLAVNLDDVVETDAPEWPRLGQEFELQVLATPGAFEDDDVELVLTAHESNSLLVRNVMDEFVVGGAVTEDLFAGKLPKEPGLWKMQVRFVSHAWTNGDGEREDDFGFEVLSVEKQ